jgi:hypothetical protein
MVKWQGCGKNRSYLETMRKISGPRIETEAFRFEAEVVAAHLNYCAWVCQFSLQRGCQLFQSDSPLRPHQQE